MEIITPVLGKVKWVQMIFFFLFTQTRMTFLYEIEEVVLGSKNKNSTGSILDRISVLQELNSE